MTLTATPNDLDVPYDLSESQRRAFREDGFIRLPKVLSGETLAHFAGEITRLTLELNPNKDKPLDARDTYGKAFIQVGNLWEHSPFVKQFSFSKRLARIAAELLDCDGVRMYHDQALYKEPGGGFTPWHADQQYWPFATAKCVTAWIPLQATPLEMGPLCFGKGTHVKNMGRDLEISDDSEQRIREMIQQNGVVEVFESYAAGDVSFHLGWTLHRAGPNTTSEPRRVHTIIYMDQDIRLAVPKNKNQEVDRQELAPGVSVGEVIDGPRTPVIYTNRIGQG
jgi:ectoine hydroxylase-related dioxygenase (phytanoyl-CoA dioxygenase family)